MQKRPASYSVTTAIDYVNAAPHIGHAYEKIATDVVARFYRLWNVPTWFVTGTDEHGAKVANTAEAKGVSPKHHTHELSESFKSTWRLLNISYDRFVRTTDEDHRKVVYELWDRLLKKGDIYKDAYVGHYCLGCESFLSERDLDADGACQIHHTVPKPVEEENYFFRLTKYKDPLRELIEGGEEGSKYVQPDIRLPELLNILEHLQDISVSRPTSSVAWGIPVPNDPQQTIYVWIDALSNYLTGVGFLSDDALFQKFWPVNCHMIGKDILRFHALYWTAMLLSAELPLPKMIYAHGFINLNDSKISKTAGNVIDPDDIMKRYELKNADPLRYYLMTVSPFGQDGNFTELDFKHRINADLSNNLGNLLNRTLNMTKKYCGGAIPEQSQQSTVAIIKTADQVEVRFEPLTEGELQAIQQAYQAFQFQTVAELIIHVADRGNKLVHQAEPWTLYKEGRQEDLEKVLYTVLDLLRQVAILLSPFTPNLSADIFSQLGYADGALDSMTWADVIHASIPGGQMTALKGPLLPRLEDELVGAAGKKG